MNKNWNCDGGVCTKEDGPVRVYPLGSGGNLIVCQACWEHENRYRRSRGWTVINWNTAEEYNNA